MDTKTFYDRISGAYDLIADSSEGACREQGLHALDSRADERVLEIGFGTGHALMALADAVGPNGRVYGIELSAGMLSVACSRVLSVRGGRVWLALDDARGLCFQNAVFDAVFMSFTLELFDLADIPIVLAEVHRVLRSKGRLGIVGMRHTTLANTMTEIYEWLHRHFPHFVDCRPIDVVGSLTSAGFQVVSDATMSIWGLPVACTVAETLRLNPAWCKSPRHARSARERRDPEGTRVGRRRSRATRSSPSSADNSSPYRRRHLRLRRRPSTSKRFEAKPCPVLISHS